MSIIFETYKCDKESAKLLIHYLQGLVSKEEVNAHFFSKDPIDRHILLLNEKYSFYLKFINNNLSIKSIPSDRYLHDDTSTEKLVMSKDLLGRLLLLMVSE